MTTSTRIQKILSQWGVASRREAELMILNQRVKVNGKIAHLGDKVDISRDYLEVDGIKLDHQSRPSLVYLLINKPPGVLSTCKDPQNRPTVIGLLSTELREGQGVHPVGRLDYNSTGALILTNDGDLTLSLTHPRYHLAKTYRVWVEGQISPSILNQWRTGVYLGDQKTLPAQVKVLKPGAERSLLEVIITEGRNRQIRRTAEQLGLNVLRLHRLAIGPLSLEYPSLAQGEYRLITPGELKKLKQITLEE